MSGMDPGAALRVSRNSLQKAIEHQSKGNVGRAFAHYLLALKLDSSLRETLEDTFTEVLGVWLRRLCQDDRDDDAMHCFSQGIEIFPRNDFIHNCLSIFLPRYDESRGGEHYEAVPYLRKCLEINKWDIVSMNYLESVCNKSVSRWHFRMLNDHFRNNSFREAISKKVKGGMKNVLDIGTGTGLLSLFAADAGADNVYACDSSRVMMNLAHKIVEHHGLAGIKLLEKHSTDLTIPGDIPDKISLLVCEIFDCGLFGEHALEAMVHAWKNLLAPQAQVIPARATFRIAGCECPFLSSRATLKPSQREKLKVEQYDIVTKFESYDSEDLNRIPGGYRQITNCFPALQVDFHDCNEMEMILNGGFEVSVSLTVEQDGKIDCIAGWFSLYLDDEITIDTGPNGNVECWYQVTFSNTNALAVTKGQDVKVLLTCKNGEIKINLVEERTKITLTVSPGIISMLNDDEYTSAIEECANSLEISSGNVNVLDLSQFPQLGLKLLERFSGTLSVPASENKKDNLFLLAASRAFGSSRCIDFVDISELLGEKQFEQSFDIIILPVVEMWGELSEFYLSRISDFRNLLKPEGIMLPSKLEIVGQIVESDWLPRVSCVVNNDVTCGFEIARFINEYSIEHQLDFRFESIGAQVRSEPFVLFEVPIQEAETLIEAEKTVSIVGDGLAHAIVFWCNIHFGRTIYFNRSSSYFNMSAVLLNNTSIAPDHFEKRHSLRRTWLQGKESLYTYKFIIGKSMCPIDPSERLTPYDCERRKRYTKVNESIPASGTGKFGSECVEGFVFKAIYDLKATHLGLPKCLSEGVTKPVRVQLKDSNGILLASATFYSDTPGLKAIRPVFFPRHSEGILNIQSITNASNCCIRQNLHNAATIITGSVKNSLVVPYHDSDKFPAILFYTIREKPPLRQGKSWEQRNFEIIQDLKRESSVYGDIQFVNVTDVYRNLPQKLLQFFKRALLAFNFNFLMKTDDDTIIDLNRMIVTLRDFKQNPSEIWWWSTFKEYWHVSRAGKWREEKYKSVTYPPFPCGGGYVLSRGLVEYLANQANNLQTFQGEDVSLGIWLAGVKKSTPVGIVCSDCQVSYRAVMTSQCERGCEWTCFRENVSKSPKCNKVQLSVAEMYSSWENYKVYKKF